MILIDISSLKRESAVNVELSHGFAGDRGRWLNLIRKTVEQCREQSMPFKFCWFETNEIYNIQSYFCEYGEHMDQEGIHIVNLMKEKYNVADDDFVIFFSESARVDALEKYGHRYIKLPWFMYLCRYLHDYLDLEHSTKWYPSQKPLYTPGKPYKWHRFLMLEALRSIGLLEDGQSLYAFTLTTDMKKTTRDLNDAHSACNHVSFQIHNKYIDMLRRLEPYQRNLDVDLQGSLQGSSGFHYAGFPYDKNIYQDSGFSIITETTPWMDYQVCSVPFVTEKTYRAIINCHPFISIFETTEMNDYLTSLGFCTFDDYIDVNWSTVNDCKLPKIISNFQSDNGNEKLINEYCNQIESFRKNLSAHTEDINRRVVHNYNQMINLTNKAKEEVDQFSIASYNDHNNKLEITSLHDRLMMNAYKNPPGNRENMEKHSLYSQVHLKEHP